MSLKKEVKKMRINWWKIKEIPYNVGQMGEEEYIEYRKALDELDLAFVRNNKSRMRYLMKRIADKRNYKFV